MTKFHVNDKGNIGRCTAQNGNCRFGGEDAHSSSKEEARAKAEQKLEAEYSSLGKPVVKRPIDHLTSLLFIKPLPMPRDMRSPMPDEFKRPRDPKGYRDSFDTDPALGSAAGPTAKPEAKPDPFAEFVERVEIARTESLPDLQLSQAAWNVNRDRVFSREIPVVNDDFKSFYNDSRIENSNLTLQGWEPENSTHDFVVKDLVSSTLAQHSLRLAIDGIREDPFAKAFDSKNGVETVGKPNNSNADLETVSDFSSGCVSALIDATERAKRRSFNAADTEDGRKKELRSFLEEEAVLYKMAYEQDSSEFNEGRVWIIEEYLEEDM